MRFFAIKVQQFHSEKHPMGEWYRMPGNLVLFPSRKAAEEKLAEIMSASNAIREEAEKILLKLTGGEIKFQPVIVEFMLSEVTATVERSAT